MKKPIGNTVTLIKYQRYNQYIWYSDHYALPQGLIYAELHDPNCTLKDSDIVIIYDPKTKVFKILRNTTSINYPDGTEYPSINRIKLWIEQSEQYFKKYYTYNGNYTFQAAAIAGILNGINF